MKIDAEIVITPEMEADKQCRFRAPGFHLLTVSSLEDAQARAKSYAAMFNVPSHVFEIPAGLYQVSNDPELVHHEAKRVETVDPAALPKAA